MSLRNLSGLAALLAAITFLPHEASGAGGGRAVKSGSADQVGKHLTLGIKHFKAGRYREAAVEMEVARRRAPDHGGAHFYLGLARYKLGRPAEALPLLRKALSLDPALDGDITRLYLGLCLYQLKLYLTAREEFERVVAIDPHSKLAALARERLAALKGLYRKEPGEDTRRYYYMQGVRAFNEDRYEVVVDHLTELRRVEKAFPGSASGSTNSSPTPYGTRATFYLATALNRLQRYHEVTELLGDKPLSDPALELQRGCALLGLKRHSEARAAFARVVEAAPSTRWAEAAQTYLRALEIEEPKSLPAPATDRHE